MERTTNHSHLDNKDFAIPTVKNDFVFDCKMNDDENHSFTSVELGKVNKKGYKVMKHKKTKRKKRIGESSMLLRSSNKNSVVKYSKSGRTVVTGINEDEEFK